MSPDSSLKRTDHLIWETQSNEIIVCRIEVERGDPQCGLHLKLGQTSWRRWAFQGPGKIDSSEQGWKYFLTGKPNSTLVEHQFTINRRTYFWARSFVSLICMPVFMQLPYWLDHHSWYYILKLGSSSPLTFFIFFKCVSDILDYSFYPVKFRISLSIFFFYFCKIKPPWILKGKEIKKLSSWRS